MKRRIRFIERDYMLKKIVANSEYITKEQAEEILDEHDFYCDVTFIIEEKKSGWEVNIIDNNTDDKVSFDDLNNVTLDYFKRLISQLAIEKIKSQLRRTA